MSETAVLGVTRRNSSPDADSDVKRPKVTVSDGQGASKQEPAALTDDSHIKSKQSQMEKRRQKALRNKKVTPGGAEETLHHDIVQLLSKEKVDHLTSTGQAYTSQFERFQEIEVNIVKLSSSGDGLGLSQDSDWVIVVPFCLPGEIVRTKIVRSGHLHSVGDLISVIKPSEQRHDENVKCKYFGKCGGCQYQMLDYEDQLQIKRSVVETAFRNFSKLPTDCVPSVLSTIPSPLTYHYRTKITPHFDVPSKNFDKSKWQIEIGFMQKGRRHTMDIEECPIATPVLNKALPAIRQNVKDNFSKYKKGATLLLRDSFVEPEQSADQTTDDQDHLCITDYKAEVFEKIEDKVFKFPAGSFFQNNNSVLPSLVNCVKDLLPAGDQCPPYLVDAYCGSGLFTIMLADRFEKTVGVEIDPDSVKFAMRNADMNGLSAKTNFVTGTAANIFSEITFSGRETVMIIDPPRKGCDDQFMNQLSAFLPAYIIYVSCNVHTQARDVGQLCGPDRPYQIDSLRGIDLFPQTHHVEGVCVLSLKDRKSSAS